MRLFIILILSGLPALVMASETEVITCSWNGRSFSAIASIPESGNGLPAAVYVHGAIVEHGHTEAARQGYDVSQFVTALAQAGFAAIAPLRNSSSDEEAIMSIKAAISTLRKNKQVDESRISVIGFSKGARHVQDFVTLKEEQYSLAAAVLMSPAVSVIDLKDFKRPVFVSAGLQDPSGIRAAVEKFCKKELSSVKCRTDYPGNHQWFWQVRDEYWKDVIRFLSSSSAEGT